MTPTLDSIIKILPHDAMCGSRYQVGEGLVIGGKPAPHMGECNCPRREQVAFLERLKEPPRDLLVSMACRLRHDFLLPKDELGQGMDHDEREMMLVDMARIMEEINGTGFYKAAEESQDE